LLLFYVIDIIYIVTDEFYSIPYISEEVYNAIVQLKDGRSKEQLEKSLGIEIAGE